jgi:hypothetical protein
MILSVLRSDIAVDPNYVPPSSFSELPLNQDNYISFDSNRIDWSNIKSVTRNGIPVTSLYYEDQKGIINPYFLLSPPSTIANGAGATTPGITSYAPNIYIVNNQSLGHNLNISSNGAGNSLSFGSYNQTVTGNGVEIVQSSWSIDIIQPLAGTSISLRPFVSAYSKGFQFTTGTTTGLFIFQVNATSIDGLTTNQIFIWNIFDQ